MDGGDDLLTALDAVRGARARIFLAPEQKVMFVALNKNACTSLKWMMAGIAGEDLDAFTPGLTVAIHGEDAIHSRRQWKVAPTIDQLDPEIRAQIHPENGWFVFAVVRDPRVRLFSAWQNKLLLNNPEYTRWRREPWFPRHPLSEQTVVEDFARFVDVLESDPDISIRRDDPHFRDQTEILVLDAINYSRIYDIAELKTLQHDMRQHLDASGWDGELHLPRSNRAPLGANAACFAGGVRERIERIYAADFDYFERWWDFRAVEDGRPWSAQALAEAELTATYGRRIGDLRNSALRYREQVTSERGRADQQRERADREQALAEKLRRQTSALRRELASERSMGVVARVRRAASRRRKRFSSRVRSAARRWRRSPG